MNIFIKNKILSDQIICIPDQTHVSDTHIEQLHKEIYWVKQLVSFLKHNSVRWSQLLTFA